MVACARRGLFVQLLSLSGVTIRRSSVPPSVSACVAISAMPELVSDAAPTVAPNCNQVTVVVSSTKFTTDWRQLVPADVPSSTVATACSSSDALLASSARVMAIAAPFQM